MTAEELLLEISRIGGVIEYDYTPLQIGRIFKKGDAPTDQTWERIMNKKWDQRWNKVVVVGACCGYVTSKLFDVGVKEIWAVEHTPEKCEVLEKVVKFNHPDANLHVCCCEWNDFEVPECDLVIALNVTHHFKDNKDEQMRKLMSYSHDTIIEAPIGDIQFFKERYPIFAIVPSPGRISRQIAFVR